MEETIFGCLGSTVHTGLLGMCLYCFIKKILDDVFEKYKKVIQLLVISGFSYIRRIVLVKENITIPVILVLHKHYQFQSNIQTRDVHSLSSNITNYAMFVK